MSLTISTQNVDTWKKRIQKDGLRGSTYFCQMPNGVRVAASSDHQGICRKVLGVDSGTSSLNSYLHWDDVTAPDLVELLYQIEKA